MDFRKADVRDAAKKLHVEVSEDMEDIDVLNEILEKVEKDLWDPRL